jgi:hypothetical protein
MIAAARLLRLVLLMSAGAYCLRLVSIEINFVNDNPRETLLWGLLGAIVGALGGLGVELILRQVTLPRFRFGVRSMLIVTTLVASVLGAVVYAIRK